IAIASTDPAMRLLLGPPPRDAGARGEDLRDLAMFDLPYPLGLRIPGVGPVVSDDAYAPRAVWDAFRGDLYHSPRTIWGREVNVALSGLARRIEGAYDGSCRLRDPAAAGYVASLRSTLARIAGDAAASGLSHHELWSYQVTDGRVVPLRYETSSDIQLWNLTDLAVQFAVMQAGRCSSAHSP
ncbi:MAG TPA: hypothetical protein VF832_16105, partial [Longimicrobiales bacterium]